MNRPRARDGLPQRRRAMLVVLTGLSMSVLDGAIANIALPTIAAELRADPANAVWVVNAYQLAVTISLLPFASLGELRGYRRVFVWGLAVFTLGSLARALSRSLTMLVASRILQGFGSAGIMSVNTALLRFIYPADQLGRGIGINAVVGSISAAIGPSVAAGILSIASWQWLFAINVPLGVVGLAFARRELPRTPLARHRFDWLSALLSAATFGALIIGIDNLRRLSAVVAFELADAAVAGALFVWRQRLLAYPMLALELFVALSVMGSICSFTAQNLTFVSLPFFLDEVLGRSAVETGLLMTPWPVAVGFTAQIAGWLVDRRYPAGILGGIGLAVLSLGLVLVATQEAHAAVSRIAWCMAICGIGFGFFQSPNNRTILSSAPRERAGSASGILATARLVGLIFSLTSAGPGGIGRGATLALLIGAGFAAAGAVVSSLRLFGFRQAEPEPPRGPNAFAPGPEGLPRCFSVNTNDLPGEVRPKTRPKPRFTLFPPVEHGNRRGRRLTLRGGPIMVRPAFAHLQLPWKSDDRRRSRRDHRRRLGGP
ncbi:MAG TPA: MFS transporter [Stellaceae bacterium]|nr:MFS transporter [Stellaceae bacterium]HMD65569.1 MFS transporter [Stellaceae bacterium]